MAEFSSDERVQKILPLAEEFFEHALAGEYEPLFVSDEATIWDVSMAAPEELLKRCSEYYRASITLEDLKQPLWKLIPQLNAARKTANAG